MKTGAAAILLALCAAPAALADECARAASSFDELVDAKTDKWDSGDRTPGARPRRPVEPQG